jgi:type I restriction enzyme R subunit
MCSGQDDGWKRFRTLVKELATTFALAVPRPETDLIAPHLAFFQRAAAMIRKRLADDGDRPDGAPGSATSTLRCGR